MSDEGLRAALEAKLATLPVMTHDNGYPVQAMPKVELLDLLTMHPPTRICGDTLRSFGADLLCRKPIGHHAEHQDVHGATWTPLPHLTDDGATAPPADPNGTPAPTGADQAAESATTTAAPSSPHPCGHEPLVGLYDDTRTLTIHGSMNHEVVIKLGNQEPFFTWADSFLATAHCAAYEAGEGATPAIDREQISERLAEAMADSWMGDEVDCADVATILAPAVVALIEGAS